MKGRKWKSLFLTIILLLQCVYIPNGFAKIENSNAITEVNRASLSNETFVGEEYTITHTFKGEPQEIQDVEKEIVLVLDVSGSMKEQMGGRHSLTRLESMRNAAKEFVNKFVGQKVKIALVPYATTADDPSNDPIKFYSMLNPSNKTILHNKINGLAANGGTNIGDGLRRGYHILDDSEASKYLVLMTDGVPEGYTMEYANKTRLVKKSRPIIEWRLFVPVIVGYEEYYEEEHYKEYANYTQDGDTGIGRNTSMNVNSSMNGRVDGNKRIIIYSENNQGGPGSTGYAKEMAKIIRDSNNIKPFFIGFSSQANPGKLNEIATAANAEKVSGNRRYYDANTSDELDQVFSDIQTVIAEELPFKGITYEETLPDGVEVVSLPEGFEQNGNKITGKISAKMVRNKKENRYELAAEPFDIKVKFSKPSVYTFDAATLSYTDPFNSSSTVPVDSITVHVSGDLSLDKSVLYVKKGDTDSLQGGIMPKERANDLKWTIIEGEDIFSFEQKEISIADGTNKIDITGKKVGKGKIQVAYKEVGSSTATFLATCDVYVYDIDETDTIYVLKDKIKAISASIPEGASVEYTSNNDGIAQVISNTEVKGVNVGETKVRATFYKDVIKEGVPVRYDIGSVEYPVYVYDVAFIDKEDEHYGYRDYGYLSSQNAMFRLRFQINTPSGKSLPKPTSLTMTADFAGVDHKLGFKGENVDITFREISLGSNGKDRIETAGFDSSNNIVTRFEDLDAGIYEMVVATNIDPDHSLTLNQYVNNYAGSKRIEVRNTFHTIGYDLLLGTDIDGTISVYADHDPSIR